MAEASNDQYIKDFLADLRKFASSWPEDQKDVAITMDRYHLEYFIEFLDWRITPDMPKMPIMKALGPLAGEHMLNTKLRRLDDMIEKLGPLIILLGMEKLTPPPTQEPPRGQNRAPAVSANLKRTILTNRIGNPRDPGMEG